VGLAHHCPFVEWTSAAAAGFERLGNRRGREQALALTVEWLLAEAAGGPGAHGRRNLIEEVSRLLDSLPDLRQLGRRAMRLAVQQLGAERGVLLLYDPATGGLDPLVEHGAVDAATRHRALGFSRRAVERVTTSGGSILISDAPSDPEASSPSVKDLGLRSILCVPLFASGRVIGAVYVDDSRRSDAFDDTDRGLLEGFAHLMATAIERGRAEQEIRAANESLVGENLSLRREVAGRFQPGNFIGQSGEMQKVLELTELAAASMATVLLSGENGTGKELVARIVHHTGKRRLKPIVMVNCGAIPEPLLESELFGIMPNVATGVHGRDGRFVQADGGTLFLDEVGDMPLQQQVALLSVLSNREVTPVGGSRPIPVDVRIIAATNRDLKKLVDAGAFREDLYYRLNVFPIAIPPLRERKADIPLLASHFAAHFARLLERETPTLSPRLVAVLMQCDWHGNVRELQNYIERLMAMTPGKVLHPQPLPQELLDRPRRARGRRLPDKVRELEIDEIRAALERAEGNQTRAARDLGIPEQSLRYRLRKYGLVPARPGRRVRRKRR
jgi:Nif-specific regulatory protein